MDYKLLADNLLGELDQIKRSIPSILKQSLQSIQACRKLLVALRKEIITNGFHSEPEEIEFFKSIKQVPQSQLIYFKEVYKIEAYLPRGTINRRKKFIKEQLESYNRFFLRHIDFGLYIQIGSTHFDKHYYTRKTVEEFPILGYDNYMEDPEFCTPKDLTLAKFKAYGRLTVYLNEKLHSLSQEPNVANDKPPNLRWTGNKIDLIELIYALNASGSIKGRGGIKELAASCESLFDIDLGNYYRKFIELRNRKLVERTRFLDTLKSSLIQRMEEADD
ncbi:RteC domain-containing protein [Flagellimonas meridianipacifica]|uniref:RteC protein n=1 Tax=Flagellimonas meridianipacifica TaxID=1080225 RepID=A0A2T0M975_9FLAO|nr:RteC domain-containing protein [Allomuricauda pacifica]PRX53982.1 RteC protein [Allomuricauda pacifica]